MTYNLSNTRIYEYKDKLIIVVYAGYTKAPENITFEEAYAKYIDTDRDYIKVLNVTNKKEIEKNGIKN